MDIQKIITPVGTLDWPFLTRPDLGPKDVNKDKPKFQTKLILAEADIAEVYDTVVGMAEEAYKAAVATTAAGKRPPKKADLPIYASGDGTMTLKCALNQFGVNKQGERFENKVKVWDKANKPWDPNVAIWSGSKARLIVECIPYNSPAFGVGVSLRLREAQIVELAERQGGAKSGFGAAPAEDKPTGFGSSMEDADFE